MLQEEEEEPEEEEEEEEQRHRRVAWALRRMVSWRRAWRACERE